MRAFVTGATGFIGSAVVAELRRAGHRVLGLARSEAAAKRLEADGIDVERGSLDDVESLRRAARACDGVVHTAFIHDFANYPAAADADRRAIEAMGDALAGTARPLVVSAGLAGITPGRVATERDREDPSHAVVPRKSEITAHALAARGVQTVVMRLPPSVHDDGDHGFVPMLIDLARKTRVAAYVGDGANRWPTVHRRDAARLYRLALETALAPGTVLHAVGEEAVTMRAIATAIGNGLQLPIEARSPEDAAAHFGWFASFAAIDCPASSALTQEQLGWRPSEISLLGDLERGSYFASSLHP